MSNFCLSFVWKGIGRVRKFLLSVFFFFVDNETLMLLCMVYMYWFLKMKSVTKKKRLY